MPRKYLLRVLKKLEKRKIISRKPHPLFPFILFFISLFLWFITNKLNVPSSLVFLSKFTLVFSLLFAFLHLILVRILEGNN